MAASLPNLEGFQEQFQDVTNCCICTETYKDPRILPCIHTFCMKCLEDYGRKNGKKPGQHMVCPLCRKEFTIPQEGFTGIQKNFFMIKLTEMAKILNVSSPQILCDACLDEGSDPVPTGMDIPKAEKFCNECCLKLCENCCKHHQKSKLTKTHQLVAVDSKSMARLMMDKLVPESCEKHEREKLKIFCSDCKKVVCAFCFIEDHQKHAWSDVEQAADGFRQQIQTLAKIHSVDLELRKKKLNEEKGTINKKADDIEKMIIQRQSLLKSTIDKHAAALLAKLNGVRQEKLKELKSEEEDIDVQKVAQDSFSLYCQEITKKGSAGDICRAEAELKARGHELEQMMKSLCQRQLKPMTIVLKSTNLGEFLKENGKNFVGDIEGDQI